MITTLANYNHLIYSTTYTDIYNGVVRVSNGTTMGTGILLYDGKSVLTAAHIFSNTNTLNITASFDTRNNPLIINGDIEVYSHYDSRNDNGDLAIITLDEFAPSLYNRTELYRTTDEINQNFTMVGYGLKGSGNTGMIDSTDNENKLIAENTFETDMGVFDNSSQTNLAWNPLNNSFLVADFDNGTTANDALNYYLGIDDLGLGAIEGIIASGDSGGPALIDEKVAGIASYTTTTDGSDSPDFNNTADSSFGEVAAWTRVSYYQEWIDKTIRSNYENAPTNVNDVQTTIIENDSGIQYTYFLLEVTGDRSSMDDRVTWSYTTIDGTATASQDYIQTSGTVTLYADESSIIIPVEIISDTIVEEDETFYLEVSNASYDGFSNHDTTLTAMRTIIDDDIYIA